jgi:hypothetical protein
VAPVGIGWASSWQAGASDFYRPKSYHLMKKNKPIYLIDLIKHFSIHRSPRKSLWKCKLLIYINKKQFAFLGVTI